MAGASPLDPTTAALIASQLSREFESLLFSHRITFPPLRHQRISGCRVGPTDPSNMNHQTTLRAQELNQDVLTTIFEYFATEETIKHPTETLLLVSKAWHVAARDHRALWGYFRVHVAHRVLHEGLLRRIRRRLERSGDVVPLQIELRSLLNTNVQPFIEAMEYRELDMNSVSVCSGTIATGSRVNQWGSLCRCEANAGILIRELLSLLAGSKGIYCARWRSLVLDIDLRISYSFEYPRMVLSLPYPTPSLVSLTLQNLRVDSSRSRSPFLPHTPNLLELALDNCSIPSMPTTPKLQFAGISRLQGRPNEQYGFDWHRIDSAALKVLKLYTPLNCDVTLPTELPNLKQLELRGEELPSSLNTVSLPRLTHLSLGVSNLEFLSGLLQCEGIPFSQLEHLQLWYYDGLGIDHDYLKSYIFQLLYDCNNLLVLTGDVRMLSIVLKLVWETSPIVVYPPSGSHAGTSRPRMPVFGGQEIELKVMHEPTREILASGLTRREIVELARLLGALNPEEKWDDMVARLGQLWGPC